jgi:hypothetical protein
MQGVDAPRVYLPGGESAFQPRMLGLAGIPNDLAATRFLPAADARE